MAPIRFASPSPGVPLMDERMRMRWAVVVLVAAAFVAGVLVSATWF